MRNTGLDEAQAGTKIARRRNTNNLRYADMTTLMAESEGELKSLLMKVKEESEKTGLKVSIQKTKIMASGPITSWQIDWKMWKQCQSSFSWAAESQQMVTAAMKFKDACSLEESYDKPRHILKSRNITLPTKVCIIKAMVFTVVMYRCESWTIKLSAKGLMLSKCVAGEDS